MNFLILQICYSVTVRAIFTGLLLPLIRSVSDVSLRGNIMNRDRAACKTCGKFSGLDDLVENAIKLNVHSSAFIPLICIYA